MHQAIWDPHQYLRHSSHRTRPFRDLLAHIPELPGTPPKIADLGCGPGNVTILLANRWPDADITGLDNSAEMLANAKQQYAGKTPGGGTLHFRHTDAATWLPDQAYDLIVSNAALQWVPNHPEMITRWIDSLAPGGTFALQVPGNFDAPSHALLDDLCDAPQWHHRLKGQSRRYIHILDPAGYLKLFDSLDCTAEAWETTYVQHLQGEDPVLEWTKGTALRPILTALADDPPAQKEFLTQYRDLLRKAYPSGPRGTAFPFRRIFAVATKKN
ncbi:MAG: trans-aconitate 2-methyltransferase [Streptomycetaceae bacterium]|nr:trans-aconitate 2-methyltransferase [Streptomycetaceae bacterium]